MEAVVLYPTSAIGHLISLVELGRLILSSKPSLSIHVLITPPPYNAGDTAPYVASVSAASPSITFHHLPPISLPPEIKSASPHKENFMFQVHLLNKPNVLEALNSISENHTIKAFIVDFFCGSTLSLSKDLNNKFPTYLFFTSGAACLAYFLYFPTLHEKIGKSYKDLNNAPLHIPGVPPIPALDMPKTFHDCHDMAYQYFLDCSTYFSKSDGNIVNTFEALEPRSIKTISDGLCVPDAPTPPTYYIGPLITTKEERGSQSECLKWLDSQPRQSVVFLCFGSLGLFSEEQLKEIAVGLERSGQRFLWVVRNPPSKDNRSVDISAWPDPDLDTLLPRGFLDRTKDVGLVVKNWAPQVEVLNHGSVGGFVTHCGWNSVLESICAGVPMVAWPLYAEQRFNRIVLVEEIEIAMSMNESDEDGFVSASEVEKRVTELMTSSETEDSVRKRALEMRHEARAALSDGGSSRVALSKLIESWNRKLR